MTDKIVYGVYNQLDRINDFDMYLRFKGMTLFYLRRTQANIDIICADSIEELLSKTYSMGANFCVVMSAGCILKNFSFHEDIVQFIKENRFGVAGHPLYWPGKWLELHPQFFIVNLRDWVDVGKPNFGTWHEENQLLPVVERSKENFHDDYTPVWVKATGEKTLQSNAGQGWELLAAMFNNKKQVITLSDKLRINKFYHYPEHDTEKFKSSLDERKTYIGQNWNQSKSINDALSVKDQIWLFNSESMEIHNSGQFDMVANTASGFKLFDLIFKNKVTEATKIIIYDFNKKSLEWYKHLYKWPGNNLLECIRNFHNKDNFTWIGKTTSMYQEDHNFYENYKQLMKHFENEDTFVSLWKQFQQMQIDFIEINLYLQPAEFAKLFVGSNKRKFVNLSNIFSTDATNLLFGQIEIQSALQKCLTSLYLVDEEIEINLYDCWNRTYIGKIKEKL